MARGGKGAAKGSEDAALAPTVGDASAVQAVIPKRVRPLRSIDDALVGYSRVWRCLWARTIDPPRANALLLALNGYVNAKARGEFEARLAALERVAASRPSPVRAIR